VNGGAITPGSRRTGSGQRTGPPRPGVLSWLWCCLCDGFVAVCRCLVFCTLTLLGMGPLLALALAAIYLVELLRLLSGERAQGPTLNGHGPLPLLLIACSVLCLRLLTGLTRRLAGKWSEAPIATPYRQRPAEAGQTLGQLADQRARWLLTDPASWRDLLWLAVNACGGVVLVAAPLALIGYGLFCISIHGLTVPQNAPVDHILIRGPGAPVAGFAVIAATLWAAPRLLTVYIGLARLLLAPTRGSELASQVTHLAQTRSETIDTGAAEMRRIERDLHDGAQARLVAMGMTLDAADQMLDHNPAAVRALLAEARASSVKALAELRDLVRGIHPPVLADRGLADAIRALTLDLPLRTKFACELPGRPGAAVESAAYFAVSELLANVSKHAAADQVWIDIRYSGGMLRISVSDDGRGGADPAGGTGLAGVDRRLAAFDGVLAISSPPGGPTVMNLEIPCALSSPKTSSC
jgi:signal transduction histidine kinase